ncbi:MAG: right-handed parallel beta-helix repeat-containing protein [Bacteroidaceae bacterium]
MKKILTLCCGLALVSSMSAKVVYVTANGNDGNDGSSWEKPVATLAGAYAKAEAGDQIWMAGGTYVLPMDGDLAKETVMKDQVDIYGGFKVGDTSIDARERHDVEDLPYEFTNATIITSNDEVLPYRVLGRGGAYGNKDDAMWWKGATIDGLQFENLASANGKLMHLNDHLTMRNCIVRHCGSAEFVVYFEGASLMENCLVERNYRAADAKQNYAVRICGSTIHNVPNDVKNVEFVENEIGALHVYNYPEVVGASRIEGCTFTQNKDYNLTLLNQSPSAPMVIDRCAFIENSFASNASTVGDGMTFTGQTESPVAITRCVFLENTNTAAAELDYKNAVVKLGPNMRMANSLFADNTCENHLLMWTQGHVINCTFDGNKGSICAVGMPSIINNIFTGFTATAEKTLIFADAEQGPEVRFNNLTEADVVATGEMAYVGDFIAGVDDTQYNMTEPYDYSLKAGSPAVGAGDAELPETYMGYIDETEIFQAGVDAFKLDIMGNARYTNGKINLGCFEGGMEGDAISSVVAENNARVYAAEGALVICAADAQEVSVYSLNGQQVAAATVKGGIRTISVAEGMYLVKVGGQTYKAIVK